MNTLLETARKAAFESGKILQKYFGQVAQDDIRKKGQTDFISFVDEQSEKKIVSIIRAAFPSHSVLAEEGSNNKGSDDYRWIIDPLDGTTNYLHHIPIYAVSIAVEYKKEVIAGLVYDPNHNEVYQAEKGKGAFCNDTPVSVSHTSSLTEALITTGFPFKNKHVLKDYLHAFENIFGHCVGMRRPGAAAIDLAYIASGRADGFWEIGLNPWDIAAGAILIREAGGTITDFWGQNYYMNNHYVAASNGKIHQQLLENINKAFPFYKPISKGSKVS